ncbi:MAG: tetratricopeptide repeat protein [Anaerolineae bacterium]|nr:tetratricopeptide repeat protein [Anaerolineae bacterium]
MRYNAITMALHDLVIRSQLVPPRQRRGVVRRPRLAARLDEVLDYPLTIVQAGTGYGKSTALTELAHAVDLLFWYTITEPDRDPLLFAAHLICAFECLDLDGCEHALALLEEAGGQVTPALLTPLLNLLTRALDDEAVLVLDDYHLVAGVPEAAALLERLVDYIPPRLHIVVSTRRTPPLAALTRWRAKGQVLALGRQDLAFTAHEIEALFRDAYRYPLSPEQAEALASETEGWAIALQMVWQSLQSGAVPGVDAILGKLPSTLETLFDYLAEDVLARLAPAMQRFLLHTSVLRQMDGAVCDALLGVESSVATLHRLQEDGLFVAAVGAAAGAALGDDVFRYHRLFHDFLQARLAQSPDEAQRLHSRAAAYFEANGQVEETIYHLLRAEKHDQAAELIEEAGPDLVRLGRFDSLEAWIARLQPEVQASRPRVHLLQGDVRRLRAQFDAALDHYTQAEAIYRQRGDLPGRSRALRGQAQVYLDTVRPLKADSLLEEALRLLEPEEHRDEAATLLDFLAENKLNLGYPAEARALHHEARLLRADVDGSDVYLEARAHMRTGRLDEARALLEQRAEEERLANAQRPQRFHRETLLLLSLVHVLRGEGAAAARCAREGAAIGRRLESRFVEVVGLMRLAHAIQLDEWRAWDQEKREGTAHRRATALYEHALAQIRTFGVMRTQAEPLWGLCRAAAYSGQIPQAEGYAQRALEILRRAGDEWLQDLVQLALGAGYALAGRSEQARGVLVPAAGSFARIGDTFGQAAAWLWLALDAWWQGDVERAIQVACELLPHARHHGYDFLLTEVTFLGLADRHAALPLLLEARRQEIEPPYAAALVARALARATPARLDVADVDFHPGYSLTVRTLGPFAVWRGGEVVAAGDWRREKARQVFQFLLTHRGQWFYREQIVDQLWPHLPPDAAERDFKVALNAIGTALEPARPRGASPFFVVRRDTLYGLNPAAFVVIDADDFERLASSEEPELLRLALDLYRDDYLPDALYEDWAAGRRWHLREVYLAAAEKVARHLLAEHTYDEAIDVSRQILARDNCREAAYRLIMEAYAGLGNRPAVHETYQRCVDTLRAELDVEPSSETRTLFQRLL